MNRKHTPGPWHFSRDRLEIHDICGTPVADIRCASPIDDEAVDANAARIVACVNACAEFEDPAEAIRLLGIEAAKAYSLQSERDALAAIAHSAECNSGGFLAKNDLLVAVRRYAQQARAALRGTK